MSPPKKKDPRKPEPFEELYRRQNRAILAFFATRVKDPELAVDMTGETFATAIERRAQFRGTSEEELSGWVWTIAQNILHDHTRRLAVEARNQQRLVRERRELTDEELERIEELGGDAHLRTAVVQRMAQLPEGSREAVRLRFVEDLSYEQIAERLSITASSARGVVSRALARLAAELQFEREQEEDR